MPATKCDNCDAPLLDDQRDCAVCGFPQNGGKREKLAYNLHVIDMQNWIREAAKSVSAILSMAIIFFVTAAVVLSFVILFKTGNLILPLFFIFLAISYYLLFIYSRRSPFSSVLMAFLFYCLHTIYEFRTGIILPDLSGSDLGDSSYFTFFAVILKVMPYAYIILRMLLLGVFGRGIYFIFKLNKYRKILEYLRSRPKQPRS